MAKAATDAASMSVALNGSPMRLPCPGSSMGHTAATSASRGCHRRKASAVPPALAKQYKRGRWAKLRFMLQHVLRPGLANPVEMLALKRVAEVRGMVNPVEGQAPVVVDNRALDGFMERFARQGCRDRDCDECRWCHRFAERAVRIDPVQKERADVAYEELFTSIEGGDMWRFGSRAAAPKACASSACDGCGGT